MECTSMSKPNGDDRHRHDLLQTILKGHFASDDAELIASIKAAAEFIDLPSGGVLFHQGEHSDDVYFVLSGRLLALAEANGESKILGEIGRGETVGELALFTGEPRSASIVALRDSSVVKVTRQIVERALAKSPQSSSIGFDGRNESVRPRPFLSISAFLPSRLASTQRLWRDACEPRGGTAQPRGSWVPMTSASSSARMPQAQSAKIMTRSLITSTGSRPRARRFISSPTHASPPGRSSVCRTATKSYWSGMAARTRALQAWKAAISRARRRSRSRGGHSSFCMASRPKARPAPRNG